MKGSGFFVISFLFLTILIIPFSTSLAVWFDAGNGICVEAFSQYDPAIASDGAGGAIIVWSDQRAGVIDKDIYAQRISSDGELLWGEAGIAVCISSGTQESPVVYPDGQGGAIVYWMDARAEMPPYAQIYAQRLSPTGNALWTMGGLLVSGMVWDGYVPGFAVDDDGNTYLAWLEEGPDIYREARAQKISPSGSLLWGSTGTSACDSLYIPDDCTISPVAGGGALVAWSKYHSGPEFPGSIFAQRFDAAGSALWGTNGIYVFEEPGKDLDLFSAPGVGGSVWLVWRSYEILTGDTKINLELDMAYIDASGVTSGGPASNSIAFNEDFLSLPSIDVTGDNELVVVWSEDIAGSQRVLGQKIDTMGTHLWNTSGVSICPEIGDQFEPVLTGDGLGGHIVTWTDMRYGGGIDIYAQRVDRDGDIKWGIPGMPVSTASNVQESPAITTDMAGGAIIAWKDKREITQTDIYAGKIGSDGGMVPTQVQSWTAGVDAAGVALRWIVSGSLPGGMFVVERADMTLTAGAGGKDSVLEEDWVTLSREVEGTGLNSFEYIDGTAVPGRQYRYRVSSLEADGIHLLFESGAVRVPDAAVALYQNRPNPFNPATVIDFYLPARAHVVVEVYDAAGRSVARIADAIVDAGPHSVTWNGTDRSGDPVSSGVYFYMMKAGKETLRRKMVLLR